MKDMMTKEIIRSQYQAALEMLKQAIIQCPEDLWADSQARNQFWQIAYHALFYTHLYLQPAEQDFSPWELHYDGAHRFTPIQAGEGNMGRVIKKEELLGYLEFCQQEIDAKVAGLNLEADSGFSWIPFNKHELQYYNIRHLQHHTGELSERLGTLAGIDINWVGMMPTDQS
jgi:hypothetical protein